jgi:uncharacterized secreted protein with C-terminal beta-propeller domain
MSMEKDREERWTERMQNDDTVCEGLNEEQQDESVEEQKKGLQEELQRMVEHFAEEQPIPESLLPEQVVERLKAEQQDAQRAQGKKRSRRILHITEMAAAVALVAAIGGIGTRQLSTRTDHAPDSSAGQAGDTADTAESSVIHEASTVEGDAETADENGAGALSQEVNLTGYQVASSYEEIYGLLRNNQEKIYEIEVDGAENIGIASFDADTYTTADIVADAATDAVTEEASIWEEEDSSGSSQYSTTNVQQEGVDESDVVKTDGSYIYQVLSDNTIAIVDIRSEKMELAAEIQPGKALLDTIEEIYVDGDRLYVIGTKNDADLSSYTIDDGLYYYSSYEVSTILLTYDITARQNPVQLGSYTQDGSYYTSRKVGDYIYLFTRDNLYNSYFDDVMGAIPCVQEQPVPCSSIYISNHAYTELVISSVNTVQPEKSVDEMVILDDYSSIYMGNSAIYIYKGTYTETAQYMTQIVKFSYEDGTFAPVASKLVRGEITDTFAISEKQGMLRVLTTDWSADKRVNQLCILDEQLEQTGEIDNIAEGERVYAARYIGDTAYFITYRNMDPLFVADLSDPYNPVLLGSATISGFSDYLHLYEDNLVLGIGYETDENSYVEGVKLVMFDVGDPLNPTVKSSYVLEDVTDSCADSNYKSVLVDAEKGIIGFITEFWWEEYSCDYHLFRWNGEGFEELLDIPLSGTGQYNRDVLNARGLYAGDTFYLAGSESVTSYDMTHNFVKMDELNYSK